MSLDVLLLACLCGAAARGAPTSPRCLPETELEGYCRSRRLYGAVEAPLIGGEPVSADDDAAEAKAADFMSSLQCWNEAQSCRRRRSMTNPPVPRASSREPTLSGTGSTGTAVLMLVQDLRA